MRVGWGRGARGVGGGEWYPICFESLYVGGVADPDLILIIISSTNGPK